MRGQAATLALAVERLHGCSAEWVSTVEVSEAFQGHPVWQGSVMTFLLDGHPEADRCFAWEAETDTGGKRVYAVLGKAPIDSAVAAVRAAIVADYRAKKPE